jgi:hypothetical protein
MTTYNTLTKSAPAKDHRGVDLISDALPFGRLWDFKHLKLITRR